MAAKPQTALPSVNSVGMTAMRLTVGKPRTGRRSPNLSGYGGGKGREAAEGVAQAPKRRDGGEAPHGREGSDGAEESHTLRIARGQRPCQEKRRTAGVSRVVRHG